MRFVNKSAGHVNRKFVILALGLVGLSVSCTEDPLALGSDTAPGATSEIRDVTLEVTSKAKEMITSLPPPLLQDRL